MRRPRFAGLLALALLSPVARASEPTIVLEVDASDLSRQWLSADMSIEASPGPMDLFFVMWTPGNHTPSGPIENLVDLVIKGCDGERLDWDRDPQRVERFTVTVPEGCERIGVSLRYIAGQPSTNSRSTDSYGRPDLGVLNWNTVLLYPGGMTNQEITVSASLGVPREWSYATSLRAEDDADRERFRTLRDLRPGAPVNWTRFETVTLGELVDSPVIMGRHFKTYPLEVEAESPHALCVVGPDEESVAVPGWLVEQISAMCDQTMRLMRAPGRPSFPRERFLFLVALDTGSRFGVEHGESTLIGSAKDAFTGAKKDEQHAGGGSLGVIPHEYFHAWCGKLAAPAGLVRSDFHTPVNPELLWVYEGLTSYYDNVVSVRGGMTNFEEFAEQMRNAAVTLEQRTGRLWRSVEDTARAARHLRHRGLYWYESRQGQEYYGQGAMFWMEADAIIRRGTNGERSLDDFCRAFFDVPVRPVADQHAFTRADVVRTLTSVYPGQDWDALIDERIERPAQTLDMSPLLRLVGYRLEFTDEPTKRQQADEKRADGRGTVSLRTSLGFALDKEGEVTDIVPGSAADRAGLAWGMKVVGVNGWTPSPERLRQAVVEAQRTGKVDLAVEFGGRLEPRVIEYSGGLRYPRLVRIDGEPDLLRAIAEPLGAVTH